MRSTIAMKYKQDGESFWLKAARDERGKLAIRQEVKALLELEHENIPKIIDYDSGYNHLIMEYLPIPDLEQLSPASMGEAISILKSSIDTIAHLHQNDWIHYDISRGNHLWDGSNGKIVDFGLSYSLAEMPEHLKCKPPFTPTYAAPERLAGNLAWGKASDMYAFGVLAQILFTQVQLPAQKKTGLHPPPEEFQMDPVLEETIKRCVNRDAPKERPGAEEVKEAVYNAAAREDLL